MSLSLAQFSATPTVDFAWPLDSNGAVDTVKVHMASGSLSASVVVAITNDALYEVSTGSI